MPFVHEAHDSHDAVEWAARLPGSNGRVGMYGASYPGMLQLLAAVERPPSLGAICPAVAAADIHGHWTYEGGALNLAFAAWWAASLSAVEAGRHGREDLARRLAGPLFDPAAWFTSAAPADLDPLPESAPWYREWLAHPTRDAYWDARDALTRLADVEVPALHIAGWFDVFLSGGVDAFRRLTVLGKPDQHLLIGPWMHYPWGHRAGQLRGDPAGQGTVTVDRAQVRFFRRHLGGSGLSPQDPEPPVRYWSLYADAWRDADAWPPAGDRGASPVPGIGRVRQRRGRGRPPAWTTRRRRASPTSTTSCRRSRCRRPAATPAATRAAPRWASRTRRPWRRWRRSWSIPARRWPRRWSSRETCGPSCGSPRMRRLRTTWPACAWWMGAAPGTSRKASRASRSAARASTDRASRSRSGSRCARSRRAWTPATGSGSTSRPARRRNGARIPQTGAPPEWTAPAEGRAALHAVHHDLEHPSRLVLTVLPGVRVLLTGATGFVGRHLLPALAERHEVVALVRRRTGAGAGRGDVAAGGPRDARSCIPPRGHRGRRPRGVAHRRSVRA